MINIPEPDRVDEGTVTRVAMGIAALVFLVGVGVTGWLVFRILLALWRSV